MDLYRTVPKINGYFSRKSQIFPTPVYLTPSLKGFSSKLGIGCWGQKTRMSVLPGRGRSLTISSAVCIQYTNVTDRQTDTGRRQRPRLRIASRGNDWLSEMLSHAAFTATSWKLPGPDPAPDALSGLISERRGYRCILIIIITIIISKQQSNNN